MASVVRSAVVGPRECDGGKWQCASGVVPCQDKTSKVLVHMYYQYMNTDEFRTGRHVVYKLQAHIVLLPKYRREVMTERVTLCLGDAFSEICDRY